MKLVSLYGPDRRLAIEREEPLDVNPDCDRCDLHNSARNVCLNADGAPGGLLLVGEAPGKNEDITKRPFVGRAGNYLRGLVGKSWDGPVAYDNGVRCYPGRAPPSVGSIKACRGYLTQTIEEVRPKRVVALGGKAAHSLLGRKTKIMSVRRGFAWLWNDGAQPVPVFLVPHPSAALRNRFVRQEFEADLEWALTCDEPAQPPWDEKVRVVETEADAALADAELRAAKWISFDYETAGRQFDGEFTALVVGLCAHGSNRPWVWDHASLENPKTLAVLQRLLADPTVAKVGQYVKYDMLSTRCALGTVVNNVHGDTRLWRKLMDPEADAKLYVMQELVGMGGSKDEVTVALAKGMRAVNKALKDGPAHEGPTLLDGMSPAIDAAIRLGGDPKRYQYSFLPWVTLVRYVALDAVSTARLSEKFEAELAAEEPGLPRIWDKVVRPCISALERVENWGIAMDADAIRHVQTHFGAKVDESTKRLEAYGDFNPNSPKQLGEFLYTKLGLPVTKLTKTGNASTDKDALEAIRGSHPVVDDILTWRKYGKLKGTYADGLYDAIRGDGRIHGDVKPDGARSGRLSMSDPNLQNIPTEKEADGKMIRDCFIAPPGKLLLSCDYSQIELRVLACLSGDEKMREIFRSGDDYHLRTAHHIAPMLWHIDPEDVTDRERRIAKSFNFALIYGMGDERIARDLGISIEEARAVRAAILGNFSDMSAFIRACILEARTTGVCWTWWQGERARRRPLHKIASADGKERNTAENGAFNTPVQGTANEYNTASLIEVVNWIEADCVPAKVVIPIHDQLVLEVREDVIVETAEQVKGIMESWDLPGVPIVVDTEVGRSWGSLKKWNIEEPLPAFA